MVDIKKSGFYVQKDDLFQNWKPNNKATHVIKKGDFKGRSFQIYSSKKSHQGSWKLKKGAIAFAATFFSVGLALISPKIQLLWKQSISGKKYIQVLIPIAKPPQDTEDKQNVALEKENGDNQDKIETKILDPSLSLKKTADAANTFGSRKNSDEKLSPSDESISHKVSDDLARNSVQDKKSPEAKSLIVEGHAEQKLSSEQASSTQLPPLFKKSTEPKTFPSIVNLQPQDASLNQEAKLLVGSSEWGEKFFAMEKLYLLHENNNFNVNNPVVACGWWNAAEGFVQHMSETYKRILKRMDLLDTSFALRDRLSVSKYSGLVQVQDIEAPWHESTLPILLRTDEEFGKIILEETKAFNVRQKNAMLYRLSVCGGLKCANEELPIDLTAKQFDKLTLVQIQNLPIELLNRSLAIFNPPEKFKLLTTDQVFGLNISTLSSDQFSFIYRGLESIFEKIGTLASPRLEEYLMQLKSSKSIFWKLSNKQIQSLDFNDSALVDAGFIEAMKRENFLNFGKLSLEQMTIGLNRNLFDKSVAEFLPFIPADQETKNKFLLFKQPEMRLALVSDEEFGSITVSEIKNFKSGQLNRLLTRHGKGGLKCENVPVELTEETFEKLTLAQIQNLPLELLNRSLEIFKSKDRLQLININKLLQLDMAALNDDQFEYVYLTSKFRVETQNTVQGFDSSLLMDYLKRLKKLGKLQFWNLKEQQIQSLDFKNSMIDSDFVKALLNDRGNLGILTTLQIAEGLNRNLFGTKEANALDRHKVDPSSQDKFLKVLYNR